LEKLLTVLYIELPDRWGKCWSLILPHVLFYVTEPQIYHFISIQFITAITFQIILNYIEWYDV